MTVQSLNLGFPRIGRNRELKHLVEHYWSGKLSEQALAKGAKRDIGIDSVPSNDFSLYDHVLDHIELFGAIPDRYRSLGLDRTRLYFAMARGLQDAHQGIDVGAMEMKKWFDTNYHYIVPEFATSTVFQLADDAKPVREFKEALEAGIKTRPVLLGPISFLMLGKCYQQDADPLYLMDGLMMVYISLLKQLAGAGADLIQIDEPVLSLDINVATLKQRFVAVYQCIRDTCPEVRVLLATYFGRLGPSWSIVQSLPVYAFHHDFVRAPEDFHEILDSLPDSLMLSLGLVNGRNIWKADLKKCLQHLSVAVEKLGPDRVWVSTSCSLLHTPYSLKDETIPSQVMNWMAFSVEKLQEVVTLAQAVNGLDVGDAILCNTEAMEGRKSSSLIHRKHVQIMIDSINPAMMQRQSPFATRWSKQQATLQLPELPTTTIGSFPQTTAVRKARQCFRKGEWTQVKYEEFIQQEIVRCVQLQESLGLDVLVHGEPERNDMVEYFGEQLDGFVFSRNGWVQSYGSRCVKPPILFGDVSRPKAMTVAITTFAQSLTSKPMKGMLTGPVTMLQWSFVRDDIPREKVAQQLALAIRDEVIDLESAGIRVIQIDEPALREGLPLRLVDWKGYLRWAVDAFRLSSSAVGDGTQIHSHFCYSDFNDIFQAIKNLDADVITIENARSDLKLLKAFKQFGYENSIGPGIYDIHSPRVPSVQEMVDRINVIAQYIPVERLWLNPDCGLKTRRLDEVEKSLRHLVEVAQIIRRK